MLLCNNYKCLHAKLHNFYKFYEVLHTAYRYKSVSSKLLCTDDIQSIGLINYTAGNEAAKLSLSSIPNTFTRQVGEHGHVQV